MFLAGAAWDKGREQEGNSHGHWGDETSEGQDGFLGFGPSQNQMLGFADILPVPGWVSRAFLAGFLADWMNKWPFMSSSMAIQWISIASRHNPFMISLWIASLSSTVSPAFLSFCTSEHCLYQCTILSPMAILCLCCSPKLQCSHLLYSPEKLLYLLSSRLLYILL